VFSREELLDESEAAASAGTTRAVDSHVKNLRRKMEGAGAKACRITSVYGAGYRFDPAPPRPG
jgi:two-component system response regulator BaeR